MITNDGAICDICKKIIDPLTDNANTFKLLRNRKASVCCDSCKAAAKEMIKKEMDND